MKKIFLGASLLGLSALLTPASAGDLSDMVGSWEWEGYGVDIEECGDSVCGTITSGDHEGEDFFQSSPEEGDDGWTAQVTHPATGETYYTTFTLDGDSFDMSGCNDAGVCAEGTFERV